jgi:hypothetical protein
MHWFTRLGMKTGMNWAWMKVTTNDRTTTARDPRGTRTAQGVDVCGGGTGCLET